jgi:hypothetical protein
LVEGWYLDEGLTVVLSPLGAARLGVEVRETRPDVYAWVAIGTPLSPWKSTRDTPEYYGLIYAVSPDPGPVELAEIAERLERSVRRDSAAITNGTRNALSFPQPRHLLGSTTRWDGPDRKGPCPGCTGRDLTSTQYCLICERWGLDWCLPKVKPARPAKPKAAKLKTRVEKRKALVA